MTTCEVVLVEGPPGGLAPQLSPRLSDKEARPQRHFPPLWLCTRWPAAAAAAAPAPRARSADAPLTCASQAQLRAWEARLAAREARLVAREARQRTDQEASTRSGALLLLAHSGDWTVRNGALFTRAVDSNSNWSVRGGSVYAKLDAQSALLDAEQALHDAAPESGTATAQATPPEEAAKRPSFLAKCQGGGFGGMPRATLREAGASAVSATLGICTLAALQVGPVERHGLLMLVASFGASAVLLFAAPASPLAQPRNLVLGNTLSALAGVCVARAFGGAVPWLAPGVAVGVAIFMMCLAGVTHPPGGAFALIAVIGGPVVRAQDFLYVLLPALSGSVILLLAALLCNNVHPGRQYPTRW